MRVYRFEADNVRVVEHSVIKNLAFQVPAVQAFPLYEFDSTR